MKEEILLFILLGNKFYKILDLIPFMFHAYMILQHNIDNPHLSVIVLPPK